MSTSSMPVSSSDNARVMPPMAPPMMEIRIRHCLRSMAGQRRRNEARVSARIRKLGEHRDRRDGRMGLQYAVVLLTDDDRPGEAAQLTSLYDGRI